MEVYEFNPCVYPRLLWVAKGGTLEELKEFLEFNYEMEDGVGAVTLCNVSKKSDESLGALVWFPKASNIKRLDWIAHECTHVALYMFGETGCIADPQNQEPLAYLVGWAFDCVDKVRRINNGKIGQSENLKIVQSEKTGEEKDLHRNG